MGLKNYSITCAVLVILLLLTIDTNAITASIGNARAVVRIDSDELPKSLDRVIKVNNPNDEIVDVNISVSDEFSNMVKIQDPTFSLKSGESKDARYKVDVKKPGKYEIRFIVSFRPKQGQSVGLSAVLIIIADGEVTEKDTNEGTDDSKLNYTDDGVDIKVEPDSGENQETDNNVDNGTAITGNNIQKFDLPKNQFTTLFVSLLIIVAILGGYYYLKKS